MTFTTTTPAYPTLLYDAGIALLMGGGFDMGTGALYACLVSSSYTPNGGTDATMADIAAYRLGTDVALSGRSVSTVSNVRVLVPSDSTFTAVGTGATIAGVVLYAKGANDAGSTPIAFCNVTDAATTGGDVTVPWRTEIDGGVYGIQDDQQVGI